MKAKLLFYKRHYFKLIFEQVWRIEKSNIYIRAEPINSTAKLKIKTVHIKQHLSNNLS